MIDICDRNYRSTKNKAVQVCKTKRSLLVVSNGWKFRKYDLFLHSVSETRNVSCDALWHEIDWITSSEAVVLQLRARAFGYMLRLWQRAVCLWKKFIVILYFKRYSYSIFYYSCIICTISLSCKLITLSQEYTLKPYKTIFDLDKIVSNNRVTSK